MEIKSRVPGKIVRFEKNVGDAVKAKDIVVVMEAMKMKQVVPSPVDGTIKEFKVKRHRRRHGSHEDETGRSFPG